jgi:hypothetical protein
VHFLRPPAGAPSRMGRVCFQRMWGNMLVQTICKKSSAKTAIAITVAKCQEVAMHRYVVLGVADFATLSAGIGESCSLSKKVVKWYKRLKNF